MRTDISIQRHPGRWSVAATLLALAVSWPAAAAGISDGRSPADLRTEEFLLTADVVGDEEVGEGITRPRRLSLASEAREGRGLFKTVDEHTNELVRNRSVEVGFSDCYRYEVAAYRLDRALGIGLVPVTVLREVAGETGSLQEWVEDVRSFRKAAQDPASCAGANLGQTRRNLALMYVLDQVIANTDRTWDNILVEPTRNRFFLIDHSRSFRTNRKTLEPYNEGMAGIPAEVVARLRELDRDAVDELVGDLLTAPQRRAVAARAAHLVIMLGRAGMLPPVAATGAAEPVRSAS